MIYMESNHHAILSKPYWPYFISVLISQFFCHQRYRCHDGSLKQDLFILLLSNLWIVATNRTSKLHAGINALILSSYTCIAVLVYLNDFRNFIKAFLVYDQHQKVCCSPWAKPAVYPARTTHARLFPQRHSFSYTYLLVGIPVGSHVRGNGLVSVDCPLSTPSILSVNAADYLLPDNYGKDLRGKLDFYLRQQQLINPHQYPYAYLVTSPRVLGYSFNPASFWYLYNAKEELTAMIVEVNNTFDERRLYFLDKPERLEPKDAVTFSKSWNKDFHVSPFNSRDGYYSLKSHDPLNSTSQAHKFVSNTITLMSPDDEPKIIARVFSTAAPIDITNFRLQSLLSVLMRLGWVGFLTFPRILREAFKLHFKRGLPVWYKPEVKPGSIARRPTDTERIIGDFFERFLEYLTKTTAFPIHLSYKAAPGMGQLYPREFHSKCAKDGFVPSVKVEVLSPAFYSRFVHYAHMQEAFDHECYFTEPQNVTVTISCPVSFSQALQSLAEKSDRSNLLPRLERLSTLDWLRWAVLRLLRCPPEPQCYGNPKVRAGSTKKDISSARFSDFDMFVVENCPDSFAYRRTLTALFFTQRLFFGFSFVMECLDFAWRFLIVNNGVTWAHKLVHGTDLNATIQNSTLLKRYLIYWPAYSVTLAFLINGIHVWSFLKGT